MDTQHTMQFVVIMRSEEFGSEEFSTHGTLADALAQLGRVATSAVKYAKTDGVEREILVRVEAEGGCES